MGNCLKTQLKEVVQNDNLQKLGQAKVIIKGSNELIRFLQLQSPGSKVQIINGSFIDLNNQPMANPFTLDQNPVSFYVQAASDTEMLISDYYGLLKFSVVDRIEKVIFDKENAKYCKDIEVIQCNITGTLNDFKELASLNTLLTEGGNITGEVKDFVEANYNNGRTSGSCFIGNRATITLNGNECSWLSWILTWESANKMYLKSNWKDPAVIYCFGYSNSEIANNIAGTGTADWTGISEENVIKCD